MAYDEGLAARVRDVLGDEPGLTERKMFGGLALLVHGNMALAVGSDDIMVRSDPTAREELLAEPGATVSVMGGREMKGYVVVGADGITEDADLRRWVDRGVAFARTCRRSDLAVRDRWRPATVGAASAANARPLRDRGPQRTGRTTMPSSSETTI